MFNTIRSWTLVDLLGDCEVRVIAVVAGMFFVITMRSWTLVNLLGDGEVKGNCRCGGQVCFQYHPLLDTCGCAGGLWNQGQLLS